MVFLAFETKPTINLLRFVKDTNKRLASNHIVKSPFTGKIIQIPRSNIGDQKLTYVLDIKPNYPPFYIFGFIMLIVSIVFTGGFNAWAILPIFISACGFMWTKYFYLIFFGIGVKKAGHKYNLKVINDKDTITRLLNSII